MLDQLSSIIAAYRQEVTTIASLEALEEFRIKFLGRNGIVASLMAQLKEFSADEKKVWGPQLNAFKEEAQALFEARKKELTEQLFAKQESKKVHFDVTAYKPFQQRGSLHPYTQCINRIADIAITMGFSIVSGPEVETEYFNFETLNIPADHPARDMQDTFWLDVPSLLLRTHTSSVQAHVMQTQKPPIAVMVPGRTYRHEATDASHDFMFMQCEGVFIDKHVSLANMLAVMRDFLAAFFEKKDLSIRTRPGYFPFVEPGLEIDMTCPFCQKGCSTCKHSQWIEICGAGLIHPNVLKAHHIDTREYSGFAFGFGLTRLVMLKYGIKDIRLLHDPKIEFLKQF